MLLCLARSLWLYCKPFPSKHWQAQNPSLPFKPWFVCTTHLLSALTIPMFCTLPQVEIWQMLNVPWEFQQRTRLHRESRCDKWTNTYVLPHSDPEGSWEHSRILAQAPGNKRRGSKEKRAVAFDLMRLFPLGPSNCKVDTQRPQLTLQWDVIARLLLRLLPCHTV